MGSIVAYLATEGNRRQPVVLRFVLTTRYDGRIMFCHMGRPTRIHAGKTPHRIIFIREWAAKYGLEPHHFIKNLGVDKSTVSRWFAGQVPAEANLPRLAAYLHCEIADLFREPGDDWMRRFFQNRAAEEIEHIKRSMETTFPMKTATPNRK